jgi:hypothetical protein
MKYIITGIEKVRDVIEAEDQESAEMLFRARYRCVYKITDVRAKKSLPITSSGKGAK